MLDEPALLTKYPELGQQTINWTGLLSTPFASPLSLTGTFFISTVICNEKLPETPDEIPVCKGISFPSFKTKNEPTVLGSIV